MSGNTFGQLFSVTNFGESHGPAIGTVIDGCPPGLPLSEEDIQVELDRRRPGQSRFTTQRAEADKVKILSGVFEGVTTGTPIALLIENTDQKSKDYLDIKDKFRPGHADYTYFKKYGVRDYRGGGRASARETATRVAAGAIAKKYLRDTQQIHIRGCLTQMGEMSLACEDWEAVNQNPFFCAEPAKLGELESYIDSIRKAQDSIGACVHVEALNVPPGLGEPVFDRLDANIAHALMSINAVKGVEIGAGFASAAQRGSEHRDEMTIDPESGEVTFLSNCAGGILGGISTGQTVSARMALKPTSSIPMPGKTIDTQGHTTAIRTKGRHDPCVGIRAVPIAEAMLALVLMDHFLRDRGQIDKSESIKRA